MPDTPLPKPTKAELAILQVLWQHGPQTVRFVNDEPAQNFGFYRRSDTRLLRCSFTCKLGNTKLVAKALRPGAAQQERGRAQ